LPGKRGVRSLDLLRPWQRFFGSRRTAAGATAAAVSIRCLYASCADGEGPGSSPRERSIALSVTRTAAARAREAPDVRRASFPLFAGAVASPVLAEACAPQQGERLGPDARFPTKARASSALRPLLLFGA
jgi:hypothetical protein